MPVEQHLVSREQGDGAGDEIDDLYDGEEYQTKDQRAETRTTFYKRDIDSHVNDERIAAQLKRALEYHEGQYAGGSSQSRGTQNHYEDQRRYVGTFSSHLGLTKAQKARVEHLVLDVLSVNSFGHYSTEQVVLGVINVVVREDGWYIEDEEQFHEYMRHVGITNKSESEDVPDMKTMRRLRTLVRERVPSKAA